MEFKEFLKTRRLELRMTQEELANRLTRKGHETSYARVSHWESGRNKPPLADDRFRSALAESLEMDVNTMMSLLGYIVTKEQQGERARLAAQIVDHLPDDAQELAIDYLRVLEKRFVEQN